MPDSSPDPAAASARMTRRRFLQLGGAGLVVVGGGLAGTRLLGGEPPAKASPVGPTAAVVAETEAARPSTGQVVRRRLRAAPATVDLGGRSVSTWAYDGLGPDREIRAKAGDELRVTLRNDLPAETSIHWHGLALRNDMDGVPGVTQDPIQPGGTFEYAFVLPDPGTYFFHPHVGVQLDTGLLAPLIIEDPAEPGGYDQEVVLTLDDWTDGWSTSPDDLLAGFRTNGMAMGGTAMGGMDTGGMDTGGMATGGMDTGGMATGGMDMGTRAGPADPRAPLGQDTGDVAYPAHLINGRLPGASVTVDSAPGRRIRFRIVNAGSDTAYRFAVGGHKLTVTHSDGFPARPVEADTLILGMGERYDVVVTAGDGAFPIVAVPEGKDDPAGFAVLRTASGSAPAPGTRPAELAGRLLAYADLVPTDEVTLPARRPDRTVDAVLTMAGGGRQWLINGKAFPDHDPLDIRAGERVRLVFDNRSMMFHPMHLHGHTFAVADRAGRGLRKDTINVLPMQKLTVDFDADNPGQWAVHCHNTYHLELGMMSVVSYLA